MLALETYLRELHDIRSSGAAVEETASYSVLAKLLTEVGKQLKPKVRCIMGLRDLGAGFPDGGLFTEEQFDKRHALTPLPGQIPSRGVIEVKPVKSDAWVTAEGEQVSRYWGKYRQVLVTNYRDFVLVGQDAEARLAKLESFRLADTEKAFWAAAAHPRSLADKIGVRFEEYLLRVMRHAAQLAAPEDVAWFLASYARDAKARIEGVDLPALATVRAALEEALGLKFQGEKGEHFFRSSLVQTLFYGVFSAWVLWAKQNPVAAVSDRRNESEHNRRSETAATSPRFDWYTTARYLRVPMISKLFHLVAAPQELEALKLTEVLDWATLVLNRVDRRLFFDKFQESHAVQYFYEPFLEAFDPDLRKELGVWYTPPEIVKYMVERVDTVLRQELGVSLGLADKNVYVLDPCCGTGSYLVEVLDRIHRTIKERGEDGLTASDLKDAAQHRVFGFEILPAPFVVSHLQLGLLLQNLGAPLSDKGNERVGVYLTNALTGWEPPKGPKQRLIFPELEEERDAADHVKRDVPILVILGNPPYNAFAGVSPEEEQRLVEPYKTGLISKWGIKKFNLDDLYVRFFRLAERRIAEGKPGKGIVCYISNFSYLSDPSFVVMRERFLKEFDKLWFDCMNGDSRETGKLTPDGKPDPSVFSTERNREGIRVGTAIGLLVRVGAGLARPEKGAASGAPTRTVRFRNFWGVSKNADLVESLNEPDLGIHFELAQPQKANRYSFRPEAVTGNYREWPRISDLCEVNYNGPVERRGFALISLGRAELVSRMRSYFDASVSDEEVRHIYPSLMMTGNRIVGPEARRKVLKDFEKYDEKCIVHYPFKPFDVRWCYLENLRPLFSEPSPQLLLQRGVRGNGFLITRDTADKDPEGPPYYWSPLVCDYDCISGHARHFPIRVIPRPKASKRPAQIEMRQGQENSLHEPRANLSPTTRTYLAKLGVENPDGDAEAAALVWMHALAIGYSPAYLAENADGIRQDWPRIPLPNTKEALLASAALGKQIAALLDTEADAGAVHEPPLQNIAMPTRADGKPLDETKDLAVTAGWGHAGKGGITMPGKGKIVERDFTEPERAAVAALYERRFPPDENSAVPALSGVNSDRRYNLGDRTCDVYLNEAAYWSNIPIRVWEYTIGGYQVIKKWLSYREEKLLGRPLKKDEVRYVQEIARRITAILLLEPALDANYRHIKEHAYPWNA